MESRRIVVTVKAARNLSARDRTNTADTYAVLSVPQGSAAVRYHTKPAHKSLDPVWTSGVFDVFVPAQKCVTPHSARAKTHHPAHPRIAYLFLFHFLSFSEF